MNVLPKSRIFALLLGVVVGLFFVNCSTTKPPDYSFERSVQEPVIAKTCMAGVAVDTTVQCYMLAWRQPIDTTNLVKIHIWIDTTVITSQQQSVPDSALKSSLTRVYNPLAGLTDSMDLSQLLKTHKNRDTVQISMWAEYSDNGIRGPIVHSVVIMGDDMPPARIQFADSETSSNVVISWTRPIDQTDFYHQNIINGLIRGYDFYVQSLDTTQDLTKATVSLLVNGQVALDSTLLSNKRWSFAADTFSLVNLAPIKSELHFAIKDGLGFQTDTTKNSFQVIIAGVNPQTQFNVQITAYDISGNHSLSEQRLINTTDTIPPVVSKAFKFFPDSADASHVALKKNRVIFYWLKAVDPLVKDSAVNAENVAAGKHPNYCSPCSRDVKSYTVQFLNNGTWTSLLAPAGDTGNPATTSYDTTTSDSLVVDAGGGYVADTLRWVIPGQKLYVRMRAVDSSGAVSPWLVDTVHTAARGLTATNSCPSGFIPVHKRDGADTSAYAVFCIEAYEHATNNAYMRDVLYADARSSCQALSNSSYSVDLCSEDDWFSACIDGGSTYGTIQEDPFYALDFLTQHCNVGTSDTAVSVRDPMCVSASGVHDLPGQLQEWARGSQRHYDTLASGLIDSSKIDSVGILKGSSYVSFQVSDPTLLAQCSAISRPARQRPSYTTQLVYIYRGANNLFDTLLTKDTTRTLYVTADSTSFKDSIVIYKVTDSKGDSLGYDYFDHADLSRRIQTDANYIADVYELGHLHYTLMGGKRVRLLTGSVAVPGSANYFLDPSVGYRCCAIHH